MVEGNHYQAPVLKAAEWGWVVLAGPTGATVGPVSYQALAGHDEVRGDQADASGPGGPRAAWTSPRSAALAHDHGGRGAAERGKTVWSLQPSAMSQFLRYLILAGCNIGSFIVSRGASFINTCTNIILGRVMTSSSDRAVTSDTLLPLFASS
jgi:hypothetical protein